VNDRHAGKFHLSGYGIVLVVSLVLALASESGSHTVSLEGPSV
jgi:hypothetical protein